MITPNSIVDTPTIGSGMTDDELPVFHVCPTCGRSALSSKSALYATAWELWHGRSYPNIDLSIPCPQHEAA